MLKLSYIEFNILLPFFFFFFSGWFFFFKTNFFNIKIRRENTAILRYSNILQIQQPLSLIKWWLLNSLYLLFFLFTFKGITTIIWWNNFKINNFILLLVFFLFFILFIFFFFLLFLKSNIDTYTIDYFFSILNLSSILPIFFLQITFLRFFLF